MPARTRRASAPGTSVAVAVLVVVGVAAGGVALAPLADRGATAAAVSLTVSGDTLALVHRGGSSLDVSELRLVVSVDGTRLRHQPPVPFFAARGFHAGPTGPFNRGSDGRWSPGERATLTLAGTNRPGVDAGDTVTVRLVVDGRLTAKVSARAG